MTREKSKIIRASYIFICHFAFSILIFVFTGSVHAFNSSPPNNKFGIHLAQPEEHDIQRASDLVNSTGGRWGYVTLVMQENDRDRNKWQNVFNQLRKYHLIPIIRLATRAEGPHWKRPSKDEAGEWAYFLSSLTWVVKDRYIVLFNEPNHGSEWGGSVDAVGYAEVAQAFAKALKEKDKNFFVMLAGLDAAAPSSAPAYADEATFIGDLLNAQPDIFQYIDGWASHSYPNPGYQGTPDDRGRNTVRNYEWELDLLKNLGVNQDLPVFITEAGWPHINLSPETVGSYIVGSFENIWLPDDRVRAVTPFVLNYQGEPFAAFSWIRPGGEEVYSHYTQVQGAAKIAGDPEIIHGGSISFFRPKELLIRSTYHFQLLLKNTGEGLWDKDDDYILKLEGLDDKRYFFSDISDLGPGSERIVDLYLKTDSQAGNQNLKIVLYKKDKKIIDGGIWNFQKLPLPSLDVHLSFFPKITPQDGIVEIQIFDQNEELVYKKREVGIRKNQGKIDEIANITLEEKYRIVVLRPYYLPRQALVTFKKGKNSLTFKSMVPLDFNRDGKFSWSDVGEIIKYPKLLWIVSP